MWASLSALTAFTNHWLAGALLPQTGPQLEGVSPPAIFSLHNFLMQHPKLSISAEEQPGEVQFDFLTTPRQSVGCPPHMHEYVKRLVTSGVGLDRYCLGVREGAWDRSPGTTMLLKLLLE